MRVLILCEFSAIVRDAFRSLGHNAWSCDLLPTEGNPEFHLRIDMFEAAELLPWDLIVAHPPCTYLAVSGARWHSGTDNQYAALKDVQRLMELDCPRIAIENPIGAISSHIRKPDQIIQPWMFGHGETKATCLWLKGLPMLTSTNVVEGREPRIHHMPPGPNRSKDRSRTYTGIAQAMAKQWSVV